MATLVDRFAQYFPQSTMVEQLRAGTQLLHHCRLWEVLSEAVDQRRHAGLELSVWTVLEAGLQCQVLKIASPKPLVALKSGRYPLQVSTWTIAAGQLESEFLDA